MTIDRGANYHLDVALSELQAQYRESNPQSLAQHQRAAESLPGGNTRTVLHFDPFPLCIAGGADATLEDIDGHRYTDFIGEYTAGLFGHSCSQIHDAVQRALSEGILLCGPNRYEQRFAQLLCERFPSVERVRFVNTGTEANLMAVTAARAFTGKTHIMAFEGGYHGGVFLFANGISPHNAPYPTILDQYNDIEHSVELIRNHADELACVLVEPMLGTGGAIPAVPEFLQALRAVCDETGVLLIFDEVMTSRLSGGGMQQLTAVTPDLTTLGKYLGGGMTFGAFGGRADVMDQYDPRRADCLPHAGTFNNNVLTMSAGIVVLEDLYTASRADQFTADGEAFRKQLQQLANDRSLPVVLTGVGSLMNIHFSREPIHSPQQTKSVNPKLRQLFQHAMLQAGFYVGKTGYLALMLPLTTEDYNHFAQAFTEFLDKYGELIEQNA